MNDAIRTSSDVLADWMRALSNTQRRQASWGSLLTVLHGVARERPDAPALLGQDEELTYAQLIARANRFARWALRQGLGRDDVVALLMPNRPDYVAIWLGLTHIGCVVALLNTHLGGDALLHGIRAARASHVIVDASMRSSLLPAGVERWVRGDGGALDQAIAAIDGSTVDADPLSPRDRALLIYTSGTTGLPKAANVSHGRVLGWSDWFAGMMDATPDDRLYNCLPMYHSVGGVTAIGSMLVSGGSVVIRDRFSAHRFWNDVADSGCTIVQYIGELCRYLAQTGPSAAEARHSVRLFCGNGLRADVWPVLRQRFRIPRILEFYAATEGAVSLYNCEGKQGAIGRVPPFLAARFPLALIRCDAEAGDPARGPNGLCIRCANGEAGEAIGRLDETESLRRFDGYTDAGASERKVLRNVFAPGDVWYRTGDLMRKDAGGYYYFVDRLGDTFRWKGENVSTTEVSQILARCPGVTEAVVYGVAIPGTEGKAGMAAIVPGSGFALSAFHHYAHANLPPYARPVFVRLCKAIDTTGTFKQKKSDLASEGYRVATGDPVWFDDRGADAFVPCQLERIDAGDIRI